MQLLNKFALVCLVCRWPFVGPLLSYTGRVTMFSVRSGYKVSSQPAQDEQWGQRALLFKYTSPLNFNAGAGFASISTSILHNLGQEGSAGFRRESHTAVEFPFEICHRTTKDCPVLTGIGVRAKKLLGIKNINVYALGIYVDAHAAKRALSKYKGVQIEELKRDQSFYNEVIHSKSIDKTLRIVISFSHLSRRQFVSALEERLAPLLRKSDQVALDAFTKQFDDVELKKGIEITFCDSAGRLTTKIGGKQAGTISSPALCESLFDIYLGTNPVSPEAKTNFGANLASVIKE